MTSVVGGTGSRSRPSTSGFSSVPLARSVSTAIGSAPPRCARPRGRRTAAQGGQQPCACSRPRHASRSARRASAAMHRRRHVEVDPVAIAQRPSPESDTWPLIASRSLPSLSNARSASSSSHDRTTEPRIQRPETSLSVDGGNFRLVHQLEALGVGLHDPVLHAVVDSLTKWAGARVPEVAAAIPAGRAPPRTGASRPTDAWWPPTIMPVADLEAPHAARRPGVDVVGVPRSAARRRGARRRATSCCRRSTIVVASGSSSGGERLGSVSVRRPVRPAPSAGSGAGRVQAR